MWGSRHRERVGRRRRKDKHGGDIARSLVLPHPLPPTASGQRPNMPPTGTHGKKLSTAYERLLLLFCRSSVACRRYHEVEPTTCYWEVNQPFVLLNPTPVRLTITNTSAGFFYCLCRFLLLPPVSFSRILPPEVGWLARGRRRRRHHMYPHPRPACRPVLPGQLGHVGGSFAHSLHIQQKQREMVYFFIFLLDR